jgi:hypothetical protein
VRRSKGPYKYRRATDDDDITWVQWHDVSTEFNKNLPIGSEIDRGDRQTHRRNGDVISLHFSFSKESRLNMDMGFGNWNVRCLCASGSLKLVVINRVNKI